MTIKIALVGDYQEEVIAHQAIPKALKLAADQIKQPIDVEWLDTELISSTNLSVFSGIWCVPASPYNNMDNAISAIQFAREHALPFLGTCAGYQHAVIEYARNVLGFQHADNAEVSPDASMPLISGLSCKLVEVSDSISLTEHSQAAKLYQTTVIEEDYHCSFGVNVKYLNIFDHSDLHFTGFDNQNDPRVFELQYHPFFIGTAFQPERSALREDNHPLITAFVNASLT